MKPYYIGIITKLQFTPNVVLEHTTLRLRLSCSTDWASLALRSVPFEERKYDMQVN